ncbi:MAG TPA: SUMF1/EgtB/PvdO family nonheme iron enzyme, partial [Kiritimatiellia bacterium]|nr:SUMF1/EgtB/PvdO family nonheme iron enzyme [Kiritimatiellia bacterium]
MKSGLRCVLLAFCWTPAAFGQAAAGLRAAGEPEPPAPGWAYEFPSLGAGEAARPELAWIPAGTFAMGNSYSNLFPGEGYAPELPVHEVPVSGFFIGRFETSNEEVARTLQWAYTNGLVDVGPTVVTNISEGVTNIVTNLYGTVWNTEGTARQLVDLDAGYCQIAFTNGAFAVAA